LEFGERSNDAHVAPVSHDREESLGAIFSGLADSHREALETIGHYSIGQTGISVDTHILSEVIEIERSGVENDAHETRAHCLWEHSSGVRECKLLVGMEEFAADHQRRNRRIVTRRGERTSLCERGSIDCETKISVGVNVSRSAESESRIVMRNRNVLLSL